MEVKHFKDINLISKVLYVISIIILVYTLLTIYNSHVYISSLVASNRIVVSESILMVITYYINSSLPYAFYSIATFSMGYISSGLNVKKEVKKDIKSDLEDLDVYKRQFIDRTLVINYMWNWYINNISNLMLKVLIYEITVSYTHLLMKLLYIEYKNFYHNTCK